jgi:hypothetical protein
MSEINEIRNSFSGSIPICALFWLYCRYPPILDANTDTVVRWHRMGVSAYSRWKSRWTTADRHRGMRIARQSG